MRWATVLAVVAIGAAALYWQLTVAEVLTPQQLAAREANLANGKIIFDAGGCIACHGKPKSDDRTWLGGGLGLKSPFGTFYVPNISQDTKDGIGAWTEADFVTAMVKGTSPQGTHYFPAFPYTSYKNLRLDDVRDLFAYLKTLPAVSGKVRPHDVPFPFNIRRNVGIWKFLFFDDTPWKADAAQSAEWNRGGYLVNGPAHCAECHSPRNFLGGIVAKQRFAGGPNPEGEGWVPNITQKGLKDWSVSDIAHFLEDGMTPDGDSASGAMSPVIRNMAQLPAEDRQAMAVYLKSLASVEGPTPPQRR